MRQLTIILFVLLYTSCSKSPCNNNCTKSQVCDNNSCICDSLHDGTPNNCVPVEDKFVGSYSGLFYNLNTHQNLNDTAVIVKDSLLGNCSIILSNNIIIIGNVNKKTNLFLTGNFAGLLLFGDGIITIDGKEITLNMRDNYNNQYTFTGRKN